jgi:YebC/PmpR family DNA-binding regulatory protein
MTNCMSGHSKWSQIKRQKGVADIKKGKTFTKLANAIIIAVKQGGGITDPNQNFRLRLAIDAAKTVNMPKENIERAIKRAAGREMGDLHEVIYEGFAPGGVAVMIEVATDNPARTSSEIKSLFTKAGASFGQPGSVAYQFKHVGQVVVEKNDKTTDEILSIALDAGAEDMEDVQNEVFIYTSISNLEKLKEELLNKNLKIVEAGLVRLPISPTDVLDAEKQSKIIDFLNAIEELEDVQKVYSSLA